MSLFAQSKEIVLASPMEGLLTYEGKPAAGVKIERRLSWYDGDESTEDFVVTDSGGRFSIPVVKRVLKVSGFVQFVTIQEIIAYYKGEEIDIWTMGNHSKIEFGELGGKPVNFRCELTDKEERVSPNYSAILTRCKWDSLEPWEDTE